MLGAVGRQAVGITTSAAMRRKQSKPFVVRCGSCGDRDATITLPVSGLRRCHVCWDDMQVVCLWPRGSPRVEAEPETAEAPWLKWAVADWKQRRTGEAA